MNAMIRTSLLAILLAVVGHNYTWGDDHRVVVPAGSKFVMHVDFAAFRNTKLGGMLFDLAKEHASKELRSGPDGKVDLDKVKEMLGFDPFEEIQGVTISSAEYERPDQSMLAVVQLRKESGNLEGLLLSLPGYESEEYGKYSIHSGAPDQNRRIYGAVHSDSSGNKSIVVANEKSMVTGQLDHWDGKSRKDAFQLVDLGDVGNTLLSIKVLEMPRDIGQGPQANIAKIVDGLLLRVSEVRGNFDIGLVLTAETEKQAEQIRQMAQGMVAMLEFAQSMDPEDEDLRKFQQLVRGVKATREGSAVQVDLTIEADEVMSAIKQEWKDH